MESFFIAKARQKMAHGDVAGALHLMRRIVQFPILAGLGGSVLARYVLGQMLTTQGDYVEAAEQWQWLLTNTSAILLKDINAFEADVRRRLADNLEALGRTDEAAAERQKAEDSLVGRNETTQSHLSQGKLRKEQGKHTEAYKEFERALSLVQPGINAQRIEVMSQLMLSAFDSGRPEQCAEWAEATLLSGARGVVLKVCHNMAGVGYSGMGELEAAEHHYRQAVACAEDAEDTNGSRGLLAGLLYKRGKMLEAIAECDTIILNRSAPLKGACTEFIVKAETLRDLGRFDEAIDVLRLIKTTSNGPLPPSERRHQALHALGMAWITAGANRPDEALEYVREAAKTLSKDQKIGLWIAATEARVRAQLGEVPNSISLRDAVLNKLSAFAQDRATLLAVYAPLGRAAYHLEDWRQCREIWEMYLAQKPNPVSLPLAHYYLGECDRAEGDFSSATEHYRQAQTVNPDLHFAKLAAQRLREIAV